MNVASFLRSRWGSLTGVLLASCAHVWCLSWRVPLHPDEVFQYMEPAAWHRWGIGAAAWEWARGLRSWVLPALNGAFFEIFGWLGISAKSSMVSLLAVYSLAALPVIAVVARALLGPTGRQHQAMALGVWIYLGCAPSLLAFAPHVLSELVSAYALVIAYAMASGRTWWRAGHPSTGRAIALGAWSACALGLRVSLGPVALLPLLMPLVGRHWRALLQAVAAFAAIVLLFGTVDLLTWGAPFHSYIEYLRFNLFDHGADQFGVAPWHWYLQVFRAGYGSVALAYLLFCNLLLLRRTWMWTAGGALLVLMLSTQPHKETRFVLAALWLLSVPAAYATGILCTWAARARAWRMPASSVGIALSLAVLFYSNFQRKSAFYDRACANQWGLFEAQGWVSEQPNATGILTDDWFCSGGATISRQLPLRTLNDARLHPVFNYFIAKVPTRVRMAEEAGLLLVHEEQGYHVYFRTPKAPNVDAP